MRSKKAQSKYKWAQCRVKKKR